MLTVSSQQSFIEMRNASSGISPDDFEALGVFALLMGFNQHLSGTISAWKWQNRDILVRKHRLVLARSENPR